VRDLLRFALDTNVRFTLSPRLDEKGQPSGFFHDPAVFEQYQECIDSVLSYKRSTDGVLDIVPFLQHLRELEAGPCYPLLTPRVYPDGSLRFPCSIVCRSALSVPGMGSWKNIMRALEPVSGSCPAPCLLPCYLETSLLVDNPRELLQELNWTR
jgi:hypothetical protein